MSKQFLEMKYHPAKKEVEFRRFQSGTEIPIMSSSKLAKYMNKRGSFVLQDHGNAFLQDIITAFDGEKFIDMKLITTKNDFEDFVQMVEYFNANSPRKIDATLLAELPDMEDAYRAVKEHGEHSLTILKTHRTKFFDVLNLNSPDSVKECVKDFSADVQKEIDSITEKINAIAENNVDLCFAGVFSAGKSALINSIIGYAVLPEAIKSKTARMFRIRSPKQGENVRINFSVSNDYAEIIWNSKKKVFEFVAGPVENATRELIQATINKNNGNAQHIQMREILNILNECDDTDSSMISIYFPIPLDNDKVQFTIYDTPGTDSDYGRHQVVLKNALSEQTHSILIFVAAPDRIEGEGNRALLSYLKEAESKDSKTSIDIGRSLFVINKAETTKPEERVELQTAEIKNTHKEGEEDVVDVSINLADKKLFFASAKIAYASKAKANGIQTKNDEFIIKKESGTINDEEFGRFYQQNRCATSEYATKKLIEKSTAALAKAEFADNILSVMHICSGVFALENEIVLYGEKFASAVRAFAIINSVDKALSTMNKNANSLERQNQKNIDQINSEIEELHSSITTSIKDAYDKHEHPKNTPLPTGVLKSLQLNSEYLTINVVENNLSFIRRLLKGWFLGLGKVRFNEKHKKEITQRIISVLSDFTNDFLINRQKILEQTRDRFIEDIRKTIQENGRLSDEAKEFVLNIRPPEIKRPTDLVEFGDLYDSNKLAGKFLWFDAPYIDKDNYIREVKAKLMQLTTRVATDFEKDYRITLTSTLCAIESEFTQNTEKYSLLMKAKLEDKKAMEQLRIKITEAAGDLISCQKELNEIIWSIKKDGE